VIETFAYADGALAGQVGGTGWTSAWADTFSRNSGNFTVVGGIASSLNDGSRFTRNLDITYSVGVVYLDLLLEVSNTDDDPFAAIELYNGSANGNDNDRAFSLGTLRGGRCYWQPSRLLTARQFNVYSGFVRYCDL